MSDPREPLEPAADTPADETAVERLIRRAGPRPEPDAGRAAAARAAVHGRWRELVDRRRGTRRRRTFWAAAAALAVVAAGAALFELRAPVRDHRPLGTAQAAVGGAWSRAGGRLLPLRAGSPVEEETAAETSGDGYLAVRLAGGAAVRLDRGSRVRWISARAIGLERGAVYVDTGGAPGGLEVRTAYGAARDVGTRFEVRLDGPALTVRVRDGRVALAAGGGRWLAGPRGELRWSPAGGLRRGTVSPSGPEWAWTLAAAPPFALEGSRLDAFLAWVSAETGWQVRFADPRRRAALGGTVLHGALRGVRPDEAPAVVLPACGLSSRVEDGTLVVEAP